MGVHLVRLLTGVAGFGPRGRTLRRAVGGRVVLVTGASEGIGAATARRLARAGARVLLVARTEPRLRQLRDEIVAAGGEAFVHPADLSQPAAAAALAGELLARHGRVDVVVSNAGHSIRRSVADTAERFHDVERLAGVNYLGPVQLLLRLLPAMREAGAGRVVNVSTAALGLPAARWSSYLSSKGALDAWLTSAAPELRADGVRVSTVYCGLVRTRMSAPTAHYRRLPAMTADEAAAVVCAAVCRTRRWRPWWARAGVVLAAVFPGAAERTAALALRVERATEVARVLPRSLTPGRAVRLLAGRWRRGPGLAALVAAGRRSELALVDEHGPVTFGDLRRGMDRCAATVSVDRVALAGLAPRDLVMAAAGVSRAGADAVLLPSDLPAARIGEVVAAAGVSAAIAGPGAAAGLVPHVPLLDGPAPRRRGRRRGQLVVLTSGTTGAPRAVRREVPLRALLGPLTTHLRLTPLHPGDRIVLAAPPQHGFGLSYLAAGLALGCPVVLATAPEAVLEAVAGYRARLLVVLPVQLRRICDLPDGVRGQYDLGSLRGVVSGSAPLPPPLAEQAQAVFGGRVHNLYGTTEAGWAAVASPADLRAAPGTVGRPPRGVRLRILGRDGIPLPPGRTGEVHVHGWRADGGWVATGDLGRLDLTGRLFLAGRVDDMIVSGGRNVYPEPVQRALAEHPDVEAALVVPVEDREFGQRFRATVSLRAGARLTEPQLRAWLRDRLAPAERPRDVEFVDVLPVTATGKARRPPSTP